MKDDAFAIGILSLFVKFFEIVKQLMFGEELNFNDCFCNWNLRFSHEIFEIIINCG